MGEWEEHEYVDVLGDGRWFLDIEALRLRPVWDEIQDQGWRWELRQLCTPTAVLDAVSGVLGHPSRRPFQSDDDELVVGLLRCLHVILDLDWIQANPQAPAEAIEGRLRVFVHEQAAAIQARR